MFVAPCCGKMYVCRLCHDEKESHKIERTEVHDIACMPCGMIQQVGQSCVGCGTLFGKYFCEKCRLYDDEDKGQYHCDACGLCRTGGQDNFFHCNTCGICYSVVLKDNHKCIENISRRNCPVCDEDLHDTKKEEHVLPCGHLLHRDCMDQSIKEGLFACPTCARSMIDMREAWEAVDEKVAETPVPEELHDYRVIILCHDCLKESKGLYHPVGLKCLECGSYNTIWSDIPDASDPSQTQHEVMLKRFGVRVVGEIIPKPRRARKKSTRQDDDSRGVVNQGFQENSLQESSLQEGSLLEDENSLRQRKPHTD